MATDGLETNEFPEASFSLTEPIDLGKDPALDEEFEVTAKGDLTLHGVTREVEISLTAVWNGTEIGIVTTDPFPIALGDYDIGRF